MERDLKDALLARLLAMADDEIVLGHRDSEWCGHAPILEEDIAFANIALDEQGHASIWYSLIADLSGEGRETYPDRLAFFRDAPDYRCASLVELPKGDWAFTILRQYLFDMAEEARLERLTAGAYTPLAEAAAKIRREEFYHLRHTQVWVRRLGLGTEESHRRMQTALDELWPHTLAFFAPTPAEEKLSRAGYAPASAEIQETWQDRVTPFLAEAELKIPATASAASFSREQHTPHLAPLLEQMQSVTRLVPDGRW